MGDEGQDKKPKAMEMPEGPAYLVTWGDMMSLLLTFFVMLISMSTIRQSAFKSAKGSIQKALSGAFGSFGGIMVGQGHLVSFESFLPKFTPPETQTNPEDWLQIKKVFSEKKQLNEVFQDMDFEITEKEIRVKLPGTVLFDPGRADLLPASYRVLDAAVKIIRLMPGEVRVCGYSDTQPIDKERYESNLLLSGYRASAVVRYLIEKHQIDPGRLSAFGYGDASPIASNDTSEGRAKNRRVELAVPKPDFKMMQELLAMLEQKEKGPQ